MDYSILASYHHGFAGGSKNTSRLLQHLCSPSIDIDAFFLETPQFFNSSNSNINRHIVSDIPVKSEVIDNDIVDCLRLREAIVNSSCRKDFTTFFGANLFPYCDILLDTKSKLQRQKSGLPKLLIHPVGSDIWQLGPHLKSQVRYILEHPLTDSVLTYSEQFVDEIQDFFDIKRQIHVLPPVLDNSVFFKICTIEKNKRRAKWGLHDDDFIICHHSSLRKIKCPEVVVEMAANAASLLSRNPVLIMVGPLSHIDFSRLGISLTPIEKGPFKFVSSIDRLTIYLTDLLEEVEQVLQVSDMELNTSLHDSFNISLMEAMACGLPVVTSDIVGINTHVTKAKAGYSIPTKRLRFDALNAVLTSDHPKNVYFEIDYGVEAIVALANDPETAIQMGENGMKYTNEVFDINTVAGNFLNLIACK